MAYRNKVFISFDGDTDMHYYRLMRAWKQSDYTDFNFYDAHDLTQARDTARKSPSNTAFPDDSRMRRS